MTNFIPIFPLGIVVYPNEPVNLHIFEPRYKQLIQECVEQKKYFGIPPVIQGEVKEMGTLMEVVEITKVHDDGSMDIKTRGLEVFKILEIIRELPDKLYSGAIVTYPENVVSDARLGVMKEILTGLRKIFERLQISKEFSKPDHAINSYDIAHLVGMTMEDEYLLLELNRELHRQEFIKRHLAKLVPAVTELEEIKDRIKLNGHFKDLEGFSFS
jgi:Lon protease-like protein